MMNVFLTGATDGIGRETALELARRGARVLLSGRNAGKLAEVREAVEGVAKGAVLGVVQADLASLASVRKAAQEVLASGQELDVLLHNAGVFMKERQATIDGFERTFAVNHLAHVLFTHLLLPLVPTGGRIIHVSSMAHQRASFDMNNLQGEKRYEGYAAYSLAKLANVMFTKELGFRLPDFATSSLHPGVVTTKLLRTGFGMSGPDSLAEGAQTSVYLALSDEGATARGGYYVRQKLAPYHKLADDREVTRSFYEASCKMVGVEPLA